MQRHQLDNMQTICTSLQTDNDNNTSLLNFYRPDALPDAQPTVSKHWRPWRERENGKIKRKVLNLLIHTCAQWFGTIGECTATDKTGRRCRDGRLEPYSQTHEVPMKRRRSLALRSWQLQHGNIMWVKYQKDVKSYDYEPHGPIMWCWSISEAHSQTSAYAASCGVPTYTPSFTSANLYCLIPGAQDVHNLANVVTQLRANRASNILTASLCHLLVKQQVTVNNSSLKAIRRVQTPSKYIQLL